MGEEHRKTSSSSILKRASDVISRRGFLKTAVSLIGGIGASGLLAGTGPVTAAGSRLLGHSSALSERSFLLGRAAPSAPQSDGSARNSKNTSRALVLVARRKQDAERSGLFYKSLLDATMKRLTGVSSWEDAWAKFFYADDVVAIKVNSITGRKLSSSPALVNAIVDGLTSCGVSPENIIVWDRATWELEAAGFKVNVSGEGPACFGTDAPGVGYESSPTMLGAVGSCFSRILTQRATALINVPVLREHSLGGMSAALKNYFGAIHNPNKYHDNGCSPFVADVNTHPLIKSRTRLNICDAARVQFHGGPGYKPQRISDFRGILVSTDPVALDTVGTEEIEKLRKANGLRTLREEERYPGYLSAASDESRSLGISDLSRIDVINMELA
jgi:uncharacterized protein (DUF362 family)